MKRFLATALAMFMTLTLAACTANGGGSDSFAAYGLNSDSDLGVLVKENEFLKLTFYPETTMFTAEDKRTGEVWASGPEDPEAARDDVTKRLMQSLIAVTYSKGDGITATLDSFKYSVEKELYEFAPVENGFEVYFTIGDIERNYCIPLAVPEYRMKEFLDLMDKKQQNKVNEYYRLYDINKLRSSDDKGELLNKYPDFNENKVYVLRNVATYLKEQIEELFAEFGYTQEDYESDLLFYEGGSSEDEPTFNITLRIELDGDKLKVTVPYDLIKYKSNFPPVELDVLPFFAAGGLEDEGYMLVPDGSGAIINFNSGKTPQNPYFNSVFGWDEGIYREAVISDNRANFPVFGIERNGKALICIIEEGSSYANIKADISGRRCSYNNVYANYALIHKETMDISSKSDKAVLLFERGLPAGEQIVQEYYFCEKNGYMGMAEKYREYLLGKYPQLQKQTNGGVPVAVEIIGAVNKVQHFLGLPADKPFKLTTFEEAEDIVNDLSARGFTGVNYKLNGWFNGSVQHSVPSKVKPNSVLGGSGGLKNLISAVSQNGSRIFLEADFLYMRNNSVTDSFNLNRDAARYINRERIESYPYSFIWFAERDHWGKLAYLARPDYMMKLIDGFVDKISAYGADSIAFRTVGANLAGDYNEKRLISREASMNMQIGKLEELQAAGNGIMISNGYSYAAPYADFITEIPVSSQGFGILDEEIPFYQIVLHGLVPYSARPVNTAEDYRLNILRSIETGAGLYFSFMNENPSVLQDSRYHVYYANQYSMWADTAEELYKEFEAGVGDTYNRYITDYRMISDGVSLTEYENGVKVIVNKSGADFTYEGRTVGARNYIVLR